MCDPRVHTQSTEVAATVAARQSRLGMLLCTTGVGMSIAANKTAGVRAALVADEATAVSARPVSYTHLTLPTKRIV